MSFRWFCAPVPRPFAPVDAHPFILVVDFPGTAAPLTGNTAEALAAYLARMVGERPDIISAAIYDRRDGRAMAQWPLRDQERANRCRAPRKVKS